MRTMSIWSIVGHYHTTMCPVPIQGSTLEVVGCGIVDLRLLERLLGEVEVVGRIATWSYACDQPRRLNFLRSLALST